MSNNHLFFIQSPYIQDYGPMRKAAGTYFPLGLGYIAAYAQEHGYKARLFDPNVQQVTPQDIAQSVVEERPTLVGISFMTPQFLAAKTLCDVIKEAAPSTPVVLGGTHPSVLPERTLLEIPGAAFVIVGEGEETTVELLDSLSGRGKGLEEIAGLVFREGERIRVNKPREPMTNLDALPFPDRSIIAQSLYQAQSFLSYSPRAGTIYTARGCPFMCVFCCSGHSLRSRVRQRSIENVMQEIDHLRENYSIDYLLIKDDTFTLSKARIREFCKCLQRRHPDLRWHCMGRVNTVDYELLSEMKQAGLNDIFFGIESGNDEILRRSRKGITTSQSRSAVEACARLGIKTYGAFILGLPGETPETVEETITFACSLPLTMAGFSILIPYPGTKVFEDYYQNEPDAPIDYESFIASSGIHYIEGYKGLEGLRPGELPQLVSQAQKRFYFRPRQIMRMLRHTTPSMVMGYVRGFTSLLAKDRYLGKERRQVKG